MQLIFFRHGIAEERGADQSDFERELTEEGVSKTRGAARGLARLIDKPEVILSSPRKRAIQTAQLVSKAFDLKYEVLDALEGGDAERMIVALAGRKEQSVIAVGHEPDLSEALELLCFGRVCSRVQLRKAGAACVQFGGPMEVGGGILDWLATVKMLRAMAE